MLGSRTVIRRLSAACRNTTDDENAQNVRKRIFLFQAALRYRYAQGWAGFRIVSTRMRVAPNLEAGLLTYASPVRSAFPSKVDSGSSGSDLRVYSGGAVLEFHQLPKNKRRRANGNSPENSMRVRGPPVSPCRIRGGTGNRTTPISNLDPVAVAFLRFCGSYG